MSRMENEGRSRNAGLPEAAAANSTAGEAEATLRLIASLPAPEELSERLRSRLRVIPQQAALTGKVVAWPAGRVAGNVAGRSAWLSNLMRGAAAAAIVCVAVGGAWGIYARVGGGAGTSAVSVPVPVRPAGGFSSAGAVRTPETLNGPLLRNPVQKHEPALKPEADKHAGDKTAGKKKDSAGAVPALTSQK